MPQPTFQATGDLHTTRQITAPHWPPLAGEGASVPRTSTHAQLAETAGQPRPTGNTIVEKAGQARPILKTIVDTAGRPRTPGSAGALAGMIFRASTNLPSNKWHAHHPPDHRAAFAPMGRRGRRRSQDEYPRPTGNTVEETAAQPPPILKTVEETAGHARQPRTPPPKSPCSHAPLGAPAPSPA